MKRILFYDRIPLLKKVQIFDKDKEGKRVRKQLEVDFVVNQGNQRYYIQVAYDIISEEKQTQEFNSLRNIPDSFKKIVMEEFKKVKLS